MLVGEKIKKIRTLRKMTQEQLSERSGISLPAIQKYENSDRNPKYDQLVKISNALQISVNVFTDIKIKTISDLLSLLIALHQQVDMNFEAERDLNGNICPDTIKISFPQSENQSGTLYLYKCLSSTVRSGDVRNGFARNYWMIQQKYRRTEMNKRNRRRIPQERFHKNLTTFSGMQSGQAGLNCQARSGCA